MESDDSAYLDEIARKGAVAWAATRAVTILACYRQKQLYEEIETRRQAARLTGHTSWSAWLESLNLPVSDGLVRTRCIEILGYRNQGASWQTILNILAYAPTAGADVLSNVVNSGGDPLPHIDTSALPGGSVAGLLDAIAGLPSAGQARRLVSEVAGEVQVYATDAVYEGGKLYTNVVYEHPGADETLYLTVTSRAERGHIIELPENVANWIIDKLGARRV